MGESYYMQSKKFGIFVSYNPLVDLKAEGLGRHLGMFVKSAAKRDDVKFAIACPSWSRENLRELFDEFFIDPQSYELIGPERSSVLWSLVEFGRKTVKRMRKRRAQKASKPGRITRLINSIKSTGSRLFRAIVRTRNPLVAALLALIGLVAAPLIAVFGALLIVLRKVNRFVRPATGRVMGKTRQKAGAVKSLIGKFARRIYAVALEEEASLVVRSANKRTDIDGWYVPTAFWPQVNDLKKPTLICVPDVVLTKFPVGFGRQGGMNMFKSYREIEKTIKGANHFVTYSEEIRTGTLINRFGVAGDKVDVIRHGVSRLDHLTTVSGFPDNAAASRTMCSQYLGQATGRITNNWHGSRYASENTAYLFYASQFRPNKNVLTLLKAYKWLRREKLLSIKLILTGNWRHEDVVSAYLDKHDLHDDVLVMEKITEKQLAGVYALAQLAVNPSLAEGGMPFTMGEAVSVGTPVIMSDIPVTKEVLTDSELYELTTFNGMDWRAVAEKIEWALQNKDDLYVRQRKFFEEVLAIRGWDDVVDDHIKLLVKISEAR